MSFPGAGDSFDIPECPPGFVPGYETMSFQFNVPPNEFFDQLGSFFSAEWHGKVVSTSGTDNTPGATRTMEWNPPGGEPPSRWDDTLLFYSRTENQLTMYYSAHTLNFPYLGKLVNFERVIEGFIVSSICNGTKTQLVFRTNYATNTPVEAWSMCFDDHTGISRDLASKINTQRFAGVYPDEDTLNLVVRGARKHV